MSNTNATNCEFKEYADAAGLLERDMPNANHPLLENDEEVLTLSDLVDARSDRDIGAVDARQRQSNDETLDVEEALTLPYHRHHANSAERTPAVSDFDADALNDTEADDEDDESYMTRADVVQSMNAVDPDEDAGAGEGDNIAGSPLYRDPDMTGTVTGVARGTATHLPQDLGADGFQVEEPEELDPSLVSNPNSRYGDPNATDDEHGHRIPIARHDVDAKDEALDATRQLE